MASKVCDNFPESTISGSRESKTHNSSIRDSRVSNKRKSRQSRKNNVYDSRETTFIESLETPVSDSPETTVSDFVEPIVSNCQKAKVRDSDVNTNSEFRFSTITEYPKSTANDLNIFDRENGPSIESQGTSSFSAARCVPYKSKSKNRSKSRVPSMKRSHTECSATSSNGKSEPTGATKFQGYWPGWHWIHPGLGSLAHTWNSALDANSSYYARLLEMQEALRKISTSKLYRIFSETQRSLYYDLIHKFPAYPGYFPIIPDPRLWYPSHIPSLRPSYSVYTPEAKLDSTPNIFGTDVGSLHNTGAGPLLPLYNHGSYGFSPLHTPSTGPGYFSEASGMGFGSLPSFCYMEPGVPLNTFGIRPNTHSDSTGAAPVSHSNISGKGSGSASDLPSTEFTSTPNSYDMGSGFPLNTIGTRPVFYQDNFEKSVFPSEISSSKFTSLPNIPCATPGFFHNTSETKPGCLPKASSLGSVPLSNECVPGVKPLSLSNTYGTKSTVCTEESGKTPSSLSSAKETNNFSPANDIDIRPGSFSETSEAELPSFPQIYDS